MKTYLKTKVRITTQLTPPMSIKRAKRQENTHGIFMFSHLSVLDAAGSHKKSISILYSVQLQY